MITSSFHLYSCSSKSLSFKGNFLECTPGSVHCTITHLPVISKIFGRVLTIRIKEGVDNIFRKELVGFGRREQKYHRSDFYPQEYTVTSQRMDCTSVRPKVFAGFYASRKAITLVKEMYSNFEWAVLEESETTEWLRVKQGCMSGVFCYHLTGS